MNVAQAHGYRLERCLEEGLRLLFPQSLLWDERQIVQQLPRCHGVDHVLLCNGTLFLMQEKWRDRVAQKDVSQFLQASKTISAYFGVRRTRQLLISKHPLVGLSEWLEQQQVTVLACNVSPAWLAFVSCSWIADQLEMDTDATKLKHCIFSFEKQSETPMASDPEPGPLVPETLEPGSYQPTPYHLVSSVGPMSVSSASSSLSSPTASIPVDSSQVMFWRRLFRQLFKIVRVSVSTPWAAFLTQMGASYEQQAEIEHVLALLRVPFNMKSVQNVVPRTVMFESNPVPMTAALREQLVHTIRCWGSSSDCPHDQVLLATVCVRLVSAGFDVNMDDLGDWLQPEFDVRGAYLVHWRFH